MSRSRRPLLVAGALLLVLAILGGAGVIRALRTAPASTFSTSGEKETRPHDRLAPDLAAIFAEPDLVRRLHLLAAWVERHSVEEIFTQVGLLRHPERDELLDLAQLKIRDRNPGASEWHLLDETRQLFAATQAPRPPTLREQLLAEAASAPAAALRRALAPPTPTHMRGDIAGEIIEQVARRDPRAAFDLIATLPGLVRDHQRRKVLELWSASAPSEALAYALDYPGARSVDFVSSVMSA